MFAKEKDELKQEIAQKNDLLDELKLKIYRLENEVSALKQEIKVFESSLIVVRCENAKCADEHETELIWACKL